MRTLKFNVVNQLIEKDKSCDFSGLIPGTEGYLKAEFSFSKEWDGCIKVVGFWSGNNEYPPKTLNEMNSCLIPSEVLRRPSFKIQVLGQNRNGLKITTNKVTVRQDGGGKK